MNPYFFLSAMVIGYLMSSDTLLAQSNYQKPPKEVSAILDTPTPPSISVSPTRDTLAIYETARYPSIAEVSEPIVKLAGLRINPRTNGRSRSTKILSLKFQKVDGGAAVVVELPKDQHFSAPIWSHDGQQFALTNSTDDGIQLWIGEVATGKMEAVPKVRLNGAIGDAVDWAPGSQDLLIQRIPDKRGDAPQAPTAPAGPIVQQSSGNSAPVRTYQDLLKNSYDEALFDYYCTSQLAILNAKSFSVRDLGHPAVYTGASVSPDGEYLLVSQKLRPYSYLYTYGSFPAKTEIWGRFGKVIREVAQNKLLDSIPIEGVSAGPRAIQWHPTAKPSQVLYVQALDGGDPKTAVPHRDELYRMSAPFSAEPEAWYKTVHRSSGVSFLETDGFALITDYDRERKWTRTVLINTNDTSFAPEVIFDRSVQDRYNNLGSPLTKRLASGFSVVRVPQATQLILSASGASPQGEFPYMAKFDWKTKTVEKFFECAKDQYETATILDEEGPKLLIRRESPTEPPNYFLRTSDKEVALTDNKDPFPELRKVKRELVTTKRKDGVTISFTLYTPPGVKDGQKLPTVFWAYPREFASAATASQVSGSPNRFVTPSGYSHLFFLTQGYAVMDEVSMPIVGPPETANNTFIDQLVMNAEAAIDKACEIGPIDRNRIGIGGHSYGAFMTANLLAHSKLFRAGIARSGAYNRTLTPFGFQNERRTFWEAPEIYGAMSPFFAANKIQTPILLIHGQADSNPGTFPIQSERLYQAIRGNGGLARYVQLPFEDHGYSAKESIEHVLHEQIEWFDTHVKGAKPGDSQK